MNSSKNKYNTGYYNLNRIDPESGQPVLALKESTQSEFTLPNVVFNLSRSYLNFDFVLNDTKATEANRWNHAHSGFLAPIDGIELYTNDGVCLAELNDLPEYTKIAWRPQTPLQKFIANPIHSYNEATVERVTDVGQLFNRIRVANDEGSDLKWAASSYHISAEDGKSQAATNDYTGVANYITSLTPTNQAGAGSLAVRVQLPLKMLYGSIFAVDQDLYFHKPLSLIVHWNQGAKFGYLSENSARSVDKASIDLTEVPTLKNVYLNLATETKDIVENKEGLNIVVPFTHVYRGFGSPKPSETSKITKNLNRVYGSRLLRVLAGIYSNVQTGARYCNLYNYNANKWVSYRTWLNGKPLQVKELSMSDRSAYLYNAEKFNGSVIKDFKDWAQVPTIIEDFSGVKRSVDYPDTDHMSYGLDLTNEHQFSLEFTNSATINANLNVCLFFVCQKTLRINNNSVEMV